MLKRPLLLSGIGLAVTLGLTVGGFGLRGTIFAAKDNPSETSAAAVRRVFAEPDSRLGLSNSLETAQRNTATAQNLIRHRSGHQFGADSLTFVNQAEARYATLGKGSLTASALAQALTELAVERLSRMNDAEIDAALGTMRGLRTDQTPSGTLPPGEILVRPWGPTAKAEKVRDYLRKMRSPSERALVTDFARLAITNEVQNRIKLFESAQPELWSAQRITPTQAVVLTYSVLSGDQFLRTSDELAQTMRATQRYYAEKRGLSFSIAERAPYGTNGVIYSSPLNLFDDEMLRALMARFA